MNLSVRPIRAVSSERWPLLVLTLLPCLWWWPLLAGYLPNFMDTISLQYPMRLAAARQLHAGTLPLWLPNIMSGTPLAANPEVAVWYPPNLPFFILPNAFTYGMVLVFHYVFAGWGAYFLSRRLGCLRAAALIAGLTFEFGSFMISHVALPPRVFAMPWLVWMLLAVEHDVGSTSHRLITRPSLLVGALFCFQFLAGASQFSYYTALVLPIYWIARGWTKHGLRHVPIILGRGVLTALLALGISAIQFLPTLDFLLSSERAETMNAVKLSEQALNGSYLWKALVGGTLPHIEDTDTLNAIGLGALLLVPLAFTRRRVRRLAWPLFVVGGIGYILAMGALTPFWSRVLPMFDHFHAPRRALILWSVTGPIIAALGAQNLLLWIKNRHWPRWSAPLILAILLIPNIVMIPRLERAFTHPADLAPDPAYVEAMGEDRYLTIDPTLRYARDCRSEEYGISLRPNLAAWQNVNDIQGYNSLVLKRYGIVRKFACIGTGNLYSSHGTIFTNPYSPALKYLGVQYLIGRPDVFDPSRVLPAARFDNTDQAEYLEPLIDHEHWPLWRYRQPPPMAWLTKKVILEDSPQDAIQKAMFLKLPYVISFSDLEAPPIPTPPEIPLETPLPAIESAKFTNARTFVVRLDAPLPSSGATLATAIPWHTGWYARSESGERLPTFPLNGVNTSTVLPAGTQEIQLVYSPKSFWQGLWTTLISIGLWGTLWVKMGPDEKDKKDKTPS